MKHALRVLALTCTTVFLLSGCGVNKQEAMEEFLQKNISVLSPVDAVLGGTFYVTDIEWLDDTTALVQYEDGHIAESIRVKLRMENGKVRVVSVDE